MSNEDESAEDLDNVDLGGLICDAAEADDAAVAASIIRSGQFILLQQVDFESGEVEEDEEGNFSVVLAEVEDDTAVVCFTNSAAVSNFAAEIAEDIPEGRELPAVVLEGNDLLDGLPEDCGLLINPGEETECYFPPGCFEASDVEEDDSEE
ncbi:MAG: SseB family protein [Pirellulaceae bacterium]